MGGREELKEKDYYKKCMEQAASSEWNTRVAGGIPYTGECWQAAGDAGLARKYTLFSDYNVVVLYDGTFVEVIPAPWVKGQHCGVCGNFDGNTKNEMQDKTGTMVPADMLSRAWCQQ